MKIISIQNNLGIPKYKQIILSIEKAIVALSSSFSPFHSVANFEKIKTQLELKHGKIVEMKPISNRTQYIGWAAAVLLLLGLGYQTLELTKTKDIIRLSDAVIAVASPG